ncbi:MAG: acyltransferase [Frankiales bacterium]|nr:acyltransferase [Frankiales bacterium]
MTEQPRYADRPTGPARLPSITGLRAIGAFGVFAYHVLTITPQTRLTQPLFMAGQAGVSFFFVLSGFVLTWSHRPGEGAGNARNFWRRRFARIVPAHVVTWFIGIFAALVRFGSWPTLASLGFGLTLTQAWVPRSAVFFGVNGVAWSLSVEALFYLTFPLWIKLIPRASRSMLLLGAAGCVAVLAALQLTTWAVVGSDRVVDSTQTPFWLISVLPVSRLPEFLLGILFACYLRAGYDWRLRLVPACVIALVAAYAAGTFPNVVVAGWLTAVPFALLICSAAASDSAGGRSVFARPWFVRLGEWSFAFYLCHQLVLRFLSKLWPSGHWLLLEVAIALTLSVAAAALLYRYVEVPAERRLRPGRSLNGPPTSTADSAALRAGAAGTSLAGGRRR